MKMILLKANDKLKVIFHKIIKTMGENVQWTEIFIINNNDLILLGTLRSLFFNFDTKRAYSNIMDVAVDENAIQPMSDQEMLENTLNMTLYTFGKWGNIKGLKVEKDYDQLDRLLQFILKEIEVEASLTRDNLRFFKSGIQITYEEVIQMILDDRKPPEEESEKESEKEQSDNDAIKEEEKDEYSLGLWHKMVWKTQKLSFVKSEMTESDKAKSRLGNQFYMVNYQCPACKEKLHMVVYPKGNEFRIETDEEGVYLARAYTCNVCNSFYTPKPKQLLAEGDVFQLIFEDDKVAYEDYQELLGKQGQRIANSNFNEYESDYLKKEEEEITTPLEDFEDYESMTQEELNELLEKLESGFYSDEIVAEYKELIQKEIEKRKSGEKESARIENSSSSSQKEDKKSWFQKKEKQETPKYTADTSEKRSVDKIEKRKEKIQIEKIQKEEQSKKKSNSQNIKSSFQLNVELPELSFEIFNHLNDLIKKGEKQTLQKELQKFSKHQLKELKTKIQSEIELNDEEKNNSIQLIDRQLYKEVEDEILKKAENCKDKSYAQVQKAIEEISVAKFDKDVKDSILSSLKQLLEKKGKNELASIVSKIPQGLNRKQYEQFSEKINEYQDIDTRLSTRLLEEKWDESQQQEIAAFMKKANPRNRKSYLDTYNRLKELDYEERNVAPVLEKIHRKIYDMDLADINKICKEPADLSFDEGKKAYEQILLGEYLPELKEDILGQIDKRLTKLKTDECEQLVNKLIKEVGTYVKDNSRIYFYNARKMLRGNLNDPETIIIQNAINTYGKEKEKYEYPIIVCDTSYAGNGESGFFLTPNHIFYHSLLSGGIIDVMRIDEIFTRKGLLNKGIYVNKESNTIKIANSLQAKDLKSIGKVLNNFVTYLKEKPESRNISYMAKEVHKVKCCYRCGYVYQEGNICPKCGSKMND